MAFQLPLRLAGCSYRLADYFPSTIGGRDGTAYRPLSLFDIASSPSSSCGTGIVSPLLWAVFNFLADLSMSIGGRWGREGDAVLVRLWFTVVWACWSFSVDLESTGAGDGRGEGPLSCGDALASPI